MTFHPFWHYIGIYTCRIRKWGRNNKKETKNIQNHKAHDGFLSARKSWREPNFCFRKTFKELLSLPLFVGNSSTLKLKIWMARQYGATNRHNSSLVIHIASSNIEVGAVWPVKWFPEGTKLAVPHILPLRPRLTHSSETLLVRSTFLQSRKSL